MASIYMTQALTSSRRQELLAEAEHRRMIAAPRPAAVAPLAYGPLAI